MARLNYVSQNSPLCVFPGSGETSFVCEIGGRKWSSRLWEGGGRCSCSWCALSFTCWHVWLAWQQPGRHLLPDSCVLGQVWVSVCDKGYQLLLQDTHFLEILGSEDWPRAHTPEFQLVWLSISFPLSSVPECLLRGLQAPVFDTNTTVLQRMFNQVSQLHTIKSQW